MSQLNPRASLARRVLRTAALGESLAVALVLSTLALPAQSAAAAQRSDVNAYDFNGDGFGDLVAGSPGEDLGGVAVAGAVHVIYGSASGLSARGSQRWTQDSPGVKGVATRGASFGWDSTSGDFDRDGYADLAVGLSDGYGAVSVLYGSRSGLTARDQLISAADVGPAEQWGGSLQAGDFDGDGWADLAIGADPASPSDHEQIGALTILYGGRGGLQTDGVTRITKDTPGIEGDSAVGDAFGYKLAAGDVTGDGIDDLALGTRQSSGSGGGFYFLAGSAAGVTARGAQYFSHDTPDLVPPNTQFDEPGDEVAIGDFDADGFAELAVSDHDGGPPGSFTCADRAACPGAVLVLPGTAQGPSVTGVQLWYQDAPGVPGTSDGADSFGATLSTGDLNGDGRDDLAVGVPWDHLARTLSPGAVNVFYGSSAGLTSKGSELWTQDSVGVKGRAENSDAFGSGLQVLDVGRGSAADLLVGANGETIRGATSAGAVNVLYGSSRGVSQSDQLWDQSTPGILGTAEQNDEFGVQGSR
jgi:hypothetical protein